MSDNVTDQQNGKRPSIFNTINSVSDSDNRDEARRLMQICNACRYCEGYCAVFPAMTRYRQFTDSSLDYLANLCHDCRGCYHSCQYAEPHEFNVNVPQTFNRLRAQTWEEHAWPGFLSKAFQCNGLVVSLLLALSIAVVFVVSAVLNDSDGFFRAYPDGNFNAIIPHGVMVALAGPVFLFSLLALAISGFSFWRHIHRDKTPAEKSPNTPVSEQQLTDQAPEAILQYSSTAKALNDTLTLKNLGGAGHGCNDNTERFSMLRRYLHHATFYGFMLCFLATSTGTIYHYVFGWKAPHDYLSLPVLFGTIGGIALCIGTAGQFLMKLNLADYRRTPELMGMEGGFIALLFLTSLTGLLLLGLRETAAMGVILAVHLGFVLTLFLVLPYSKMVHGMYRMLAMAR